MVFENILVSFFYMRLTSFPAPLVKEMVFSLLCIFASLGFLFCSADLYFCLYAIPYCLDDCNSVEFDTNFFVVALSQ